MAAPLDIVLRLSGMEAVQQGFNKTLKSVQDLGSKLTSAGKTLSLAVTTPLAAFAALGITELSSVQAAMAQTEAAIKSTGGVAGISAKGVRELSESLQNKTAVDAEAIQSGANLLLTFTNVRNVAGKNNDIFNQATKLSLDLSRAFGQDLNSSAIQLGKALNNPIQGVTALQRVGISFTESQKEQIKTLVESGKTLDAQKMILKELETQVGGSAEAFRNTMGGSLALMKIQIEDVAGSLIQALEPAITNILAVASKWLTWFNSLDEGTKSMIATIGVLVAAIGPLLLVVGQGIKVFGMLGKTLSVVMNMNPWIIAIGALVGAGILLYQNWDTVASVAKTVWNHIKQTVLIAIELMLEALNAFTGWIPGWGTLIGKAASSVTAMRISVEKDMAAIQKPMVDTSKEVAKTGEQFKTLAATAPSSIAEVSDKTREMNESLGQVIINLQQTGADIGDLIKQYKISGKSITDTDGLVKHLTSTWRDSQEVLGKNIVAEQDIFNENTKLITQLYSLQKELTEAGIEVATLTENMEQEEDVTKDLEARIKLLKAAKDNMGRSVKELNQNYGEMIKKYIDSGKNITEVINKLGLNKLSVNDMAFALEKLQKHWEETDKSTREVITTQSLYEQVVKGVAESIKGIWNGTTQTFEDAWKGAGSIFIDTIASMVTNAIAAGATISAAIDGIKWSMAAATAGISLAIGLFGSLLGGKKSTIKVEPLTDRLKKVFDDFTDKFSAKLGSFAEKLFPKEAKAGDLLSQVPYLVNAISKLSYAESVRKHTTFTDEGGSMTASWAQYFESIAADLSKIGINVSAGKIFSSSWADRIVGLSKKLSENLTDVTSLMVERFEKIKDIVGDIIGLYQKQKDFTKDMNKSITDVQRALLAPSEMLKAQIGDVDALKIAVGKATGDGQIALLAELKEAYLSVWGTAQNLFSEDTEALLRYQKFTVDGLESVKQTGKTAYDQLIDVNLEMLGVQRDGRDIQSQMNSYLSSLDSTILKSLEAIKDVGTSGKINEQQLAYITSAFSQLFEIPKLAHGGIVSKPTLAMIGESGTEAVVPLTKPGRTSQIMQEAGLSGGGNNISMTQVFRGPVIFDKISMSKWAREQSKLMKREMMRYA